jgi:hypothetical protein
VVAGAIECPQRLLEPPVLLDGSPTGVETLADLAANAVKQIRHARGSHVS